MRIMCYNLSMKIQWNKVTWYSKTIALAIFVVWPFIFFYFGFVCGAALQQTADIERTGSPSLEY